MSEVPGGRPLVGRFVRLDPARRSEVVELARLLCDRALYHDGFVMFPCPASLDEAVVQAEKYLLPPPPDGRGRGRSAFGIRLVTDSPLGSAGTLVGSTSLGEADVENEKVHLGWTLYGRRWWGTPVNPESKLLLLAHCFDDCHLGRVKIQTDSINRHSAGAIRKLGAVEEGTARRDIRRADGSFRDSLVFSILADEWPGVRSRLLDRIGRV